MRHTDPIKFVSYGKLQQSKYFLIRNLRFDVPDGRYEMKFENYYGSSGNITGEFNLTEDWKEFQKKIMTVSVANMG